MKVEVSSLDVESIVVAMAVLQAVRSTVTDSEYHARLAVAESILSRIATDAMMSSPIAKAFLAGADE